MLIRATELVVANILDRAGRPLRVSHIVEIAGSNLPTRVLSHNGRCNVVRRDLSLAIIRDGPGGRFVRVGLGLYTTTAAIDKQRSATEHHEGAT